MGIGRYGGEAAATLPGRGRLFEKSLEGWIQKKGFNQAAQGCLVFYWRFNAGCAADKAFACLRKKQRHRRMCFLKYGIIYNLLIRIVHCLYFFRGVFGQKNEAQTSANYDKTVKIEDKIREIKRKREKP